MIVLDTNVISEALSPSPSDSVMNWLGRQDVGDMRFSVVTVTEVAYGIGLLPEGARRTALAGAWAERFTARELREISAFHRSPAGRKLRAEQQDLQRELSDIGRVWGEEIGKRIQQRLREETTRSAPLTS